MFSRLVFFISTNSPFPYPSRSPLPIPTGGFTVPVLVAEPIFSIGSIRFRSMCRISSMVCRSRPSRHRKEGTKPVVLSPRPMSRRDMLWIKTQGCSVQQLRYATWVADIQASCNSCNLPFYIPVGMTRRGFISTSFIFHIIPEVFLPPSPPPQICFTNARKNPRTVCN